MKSRKQMYIEAALKTAKEYETGTHTTSINFCAYCVVTAKILKRNPCTWHPKGCYPCPLSLTNDTFIIQNTCINYTSFRLIRNLSKFLTPINDKLIDAQFNRAKFHRKVAKELESWPHSWFRINHKRTQIIEDVI